MKNKYRIISFFIVMIIFNLAANFAHPVTPSIIKNLGLNDYMFGVALAAMTFSNFLLSPFWGKMNKYLSSRITLLICCSGYGIAQLLFAYSTSELMIVIARIIAGLFVGGIFVSFSTYIVNTSETNKQGKYLTYSATIQSVAGAFGYLIGGLIGEISITLTFYVQAFALVLAGILFAIVCISDRQITDTIDMHELIKEANPLKAFIDGKQFMNITFIFFFAINILINFANTGFDQVFNYYLKDQLALTSAYNGLFKAFVGLIAFVSNMTLCMYLLKHTNLKKSIKYLLIVASISSLGIVLIPQLIIFVILSILVYATYAIIFPLLQNLVANEANSDNKNLVMGFFNATKNLGSIIGSLSAGFLYELNVMLPFAIVFVIYALGSIIASILVKKKPMQA